MAANADNAKKHFQGNRIAGHTAELIFAALRHPGRAAAFSASDWDLFLRVARNEGLLARIAIQLDQAGIRGTRSLWRLDCQIGIIYWSIAGRLR